MRAGVYPAKPFYRYRIYHKSSNQYGKVTLTYQCHNLSLDVQEYFRLITMV
ncbi:MAG: hypothetical protein LBL65_01275 [Campylobacteraceae bacterium]|nr:hypothetical protein [Campylobacteraceae bacterium]